MNTAVPAAAISEWSRSDVNAIAVLWLEALNNADMEDMELHRDASGRLVTWLNDHTRDRGSVGLIAEVEGSFCGFLLGRVGEWPASPPIVRSRRVGVIDVVCVAEDFRRQGIAGALVSRAISKMELRGARRLETTFQPSDAGARRLWERLGFKASLQRTWRSTSLS